MGQDESTGGSVSVSLRNSTSNGQKSHAARLRVEGQRCLSGSLSGETSNGFCRESCAACTIT